MSFHFFQNPLSASMNVLKTLFIFFYQSRVIQWRSIKYIGKVELDHFKIYETKKCGNNFYFKSNLIGWRLQTFLCSNHFINHFSWLLTSVHSTNILLKFDWLGYPFKPSILQKEWCYFIFVQYLFWCCIWKTEVYINYQYVIYGIPKKMLQ